MTKRHISRRNFLRMTAMAAAGDVALRQLSPILAQPAAQRSWQVTGDANASLVSFDRTLQQFMQQRNIPNGSLAVTRRERLVLARGYTWSANSNDIVQPTSLFRIASVTKPITSAAIMSLVQANMLRLSDRLVDLLEVIPPTGNTADSRLSDITVLHLLQHLGGWNRDTSFDPMFYDSNIAFTLNTSIPISTADIITYMSEQPLQFDPGTQINYSNYGYCLLGRIIERLTGQQYGYYVLNSVLRPLGINHMQPGHSLLSQRAAGEVRYYTTDTNSYASVVSNGNVPIPYGTFNLENMDSHGGWIGSAVSMARFAASYDGEQGNAVLTGKSIKTTFALPVIGINNNGSYYGCGWAVRPVGNLRNTWHDGSLPGTSTLMVRRFDGLDWVVLFNQRDDQGDPAGSSYGEIDGLLHQAADAVTEWPNVDLFEKYEA